MNFLDMGIVVSDPRRSDPRWTELLRQAEKTDLLLFCKLAGLRVAGAELEADKLFGYRIKNPARLDSVRVKAMLMPHKILLMAFLAHLPKEKKTNG